MVELPKSPSFRLDGKRALVTGASRGIGLAATVALADAGAHVVMLARSAEALREAADAIRSNGGSVGVLPADLSNIAAAKATIESQEPFDILVNNAGTMKLCPVEEVTESDYDTILDLDLKAAYFVDQVVIKGMRSARTRGSIIHISSMLGHVGGPGRSTYIAAKHGLEGLTKALAIELGSDGIRVNAICPTAIKTSINAAILSDPVRSAWFQGKIPLGRFGSVEDVMGAVLYLAGDASSLVTGASLLVDGGWTAQ
ncbi:SDR family NAD(P)-dependent oxidoreductase (plasmid) [Bradyrhizobium lupini]|uniref:SDR family NAD(P)-dependent oxidoreductase n=1 Tax=Rhizobium lupini TaxID=136996 RepID=UPI00366BB45A